MIDNDDSNIQTLTDMSSLGFIEVVSFGNKLFSRLLLLADKSGLARMVHHIGVQMVHFFETQIFGLSVELRKSLKQLKAQTKLS
ncbi:hypothetical protein BLOT_008773 [Blomia tropicalis]|nr:hypothetical protein BLOT_008773 [Blomia tropicalis]